MKRLAGVALVAASGSIAPPAPPLALLPSVSRVRVEAARDRVLVSEEVNLARGTWTQGDVDLYVAFGAPGAPVAFDARLTAVPDGLLEPDPIAPGEALELERAPRRPPSASALLGRPQMAGAVVHLREAQLTRALAHGMAQLRVRTVHVAPEEDAAGGHELVVRLGVAGAAPLVLGRLQIAGREGVALVRAEAHLCGPEADTTPLAIGVAFRAPPRERALAPVLAVRHATDDLCIRYWAR